jgi:uncharacterized protein YukE
MPDQHMVYEEVLDMAGICRAAAQQLEETQTVMAGVAARMEDGGLVGEAGNAFGESLRSKLSPSVNRMRDKFLEIAKDLQGAVEMMRDGVDTAESRFG